MENKNKKIILCSILLSVFIVGFMVSYAFFNYEGETNQIIYKTGDVYFKLNSGSENFNIEYMFPESKKEAELRDNNYLDFTVSAYNESLKEIYYQISLKYGDNDSTRTRINDSNLKFSLYEMNDDFSLVKTRILDGYTYDEINNKKVWVDRFNIGKTYSDYIYNDKLSVNECLTQFKHYVYSGNISNNNPVLYVDAYMLTDQEIIDFCSGSTYWDLYQHKTMQMLDYEEGTLNYGINFSLRDSSSNLVPFSSGYVVNNSTNGGYEYPIDTDGTTTKLDYCLNFYDLNYPESPYYSNYVAFCKNEDKIAKDGIHNYDLASIINNNTHSEIYNSDIVNNLISKGYLIDNDGVITTDYTKSNYCEVQKFNLPSEKIKQFCSEKGLFSSSIFGRNDIYIKEFLLPTRYIYDSSGNFYGNNYCRFSTRNMDQTVLIYKEELKTNLLSEQSRNYRLRVWIDGETIISDTNPDASYCATTDCISLNDSDPSNDKELFNNLFASIKINVYGSDRPMQNDIALLKNSENTTYPVVYYERNLNFLSRSFHINSYGSIKSWLHSDQGFSVDNYQSIYPMDYAYDYNFYSFADNVYEISFIKYSSESELTTKLNESLYKYDVSDTNLIGQKVYLFILEMDDSTTANPKYELIFGSTSDIWANVNSANLFNYYYLDFDGVYHGFYNVRHINFDNFNTTLIIDYESMFKGLKNLEDLDVSSFNTSNGEFFQGMFSGLRNIDLDVSNFDMSRAKLTNSMFSHSEFNSLTGYQNFDMSNVVYMYNMFYKLTDNGTDTLDLTNWDVSNCMMNYTAFYELSEHEMTDYLGNPKIPNIAKIQSIGSYYYDNTIYPEYNGTISVGSPFAYSSYKYYKLSNLRFKEMFEMSFMFAGCSNLLDVDIHGWDTSNVISLSGIFYRCGSLKDLDWSYLDFPACVGMSMSFYGCNSLETINFPDMYNLKAINYIYGYANRPSFDISFIKDSSKIEEALSAFGNFSIYSVLETIYVDASFDLSNAKTSNIFSGNRQDLFPVSPEKSKLKAGVPGSYFTIKA